jgi:Domain of unknown function (DUF4430)
VFSRLVHTGDSVALPLRRAALAALLCAGLLSGCGLGAGSTPGAVTLVVTREFGARPLPLGHSLRVHGQETVMSLLMRNYRVSTRYGGGFVESINGHSGGHVRGNPVDWFYYVDGVEAPRGAAETNVNPGEAIWWDLHDWSQASYTPAVVGSFPEPFLHGIEGKRLPVRVECSEVEGEACRTVAARMRALGVPAGLAGLTEASGEAPETLRVVVGPWSAVRTLAAAQGLTQGPRVSGVYARMAANGSSLALLNGRGGVTTSLTAGAGLIAALRPSGQAPVWVITGTDATGADHAAHALEENALHDRFAVAVPASGGVLALPQGG